MKANNTQTGIVNCLRLHIFAEPDLESEIVCKVRYLTEVMVDLKNSTDKFYKICTAVGAEGFCKKDQIILKK